MRIHRDTDGWTFEERPVYFGPDEQLFRVVTEVDGDAFAERWLSLIEGL